jgi:hypothetical protein
MRLKMHRKRLWWLIPYLAALCGAVGVFLLYMPELNTRFFTGTYNSLSRFVIESGVADILLVLWLWVIAYLLGKRLLNRVGIGCDSTAEEVSFASGAGLVVLTAVIFFLGVVHLLDPWAAYGLLTAFSIAHRRDLNELAIRAWTRLRATRLPQRVTFAAAGRAFLRIYIVVVLGIVLVSALAPETEYDPLLYHLEVAKVISHTHRFTPLRDIAQSFFPKNIAILFSFGMLLHSEIAAKLVHYLLGLLTIISAYALALRLGLRTAALLASAIVVSTPIFIWEMRTANIDCGLALSVFLSLYATIVWIENGQKGWFSLAVLFTAWSLGAKYHALFSLGALTVLVLFHTFRERKQVWPACRQAAKFFLLSSIGLLPWGIVNLLQTGNPVFPLLNSFFQSPYWNDQMLAQTMGQVDRVTLSNWWSVFTFPWDMVMNYTDRWGGNIGPFYLILLPLLILVRRVRREIFLIVLFSVLFTLCWLFTGEHVRYYLGILPALAVVAAYAVTRCMNVLEQSGHKFAVELDGVTLGAMLLLHTPLSESDGAGSKYGSGVWQSVSVPLLLGQETRDRYLEQRVPDYPAVEYLNSLPVPKRVLFWWNAAPIAFYLEGESSSVWSYFFAELMGDDPAQLHRVLLKHGITHAVVGVPAQENSFFTNPKKEFVQRYLKTVYQDKERIVYEVLRQPIARASIISVVEATYGANCGAAGGNATALVKSDCDGRHTCGFPVELAKTGDPAPGCAKDFKVQWTCGRDGRAHEASIAAEAGFGGLAVLTCLL